MASLATRGIQSSLSISGLSWCWRCFLFRCSSFASTSARLFCRITQSFCPASSRSPSSFLSQVTSFISSTACFVLTAGLRSRGLTRSWLLVRQGYSQNCKSFTAASVVRSSRNMPPNKALQRTFLPPLRYGKNAAELVRWAARQATRGVLAWQSGSTT